jgi:hypothetical protein
MSPSGPKTEVAALRRDICFAPVNGHRLAVSACPFAASRLVHRSTHADSAVLLWAALQLLQINAG